MGAGINTDPDEAQVHADIDGLAVCGKYAAHEAPSWTHTMELFRPGVQVLHSTRTSVGLTAGMVTTVLAVVMKYPSQSRFVW